MKMTLRELRVEYDHRLAERLGHLCEDREPTPAQLAMAEAEARAVIDELNRQSRREQGIL